MLSGFDLENVILKASVWALPILLAITLHEAAHGWAASKLGDPTARLMGRVTLNPFAHIDPIGTVLIPIGLLMIGAPFVFGYAKPVPVNFSRLRNFRRDMALVALAGPASNILLAIGALAVAHLAPMPSIANASVAEMVLAASHPELTNWPWITSMLLLMIGLNLILAVFNMLPIPPLDGGRILVAVLPDWAAWKVARLERAGLFIVIGLLFLVPALSRELGYSLDVTGVLIWLPVDALMTVLAVLTGH